jgi:cytochrome c6
MQSKLKIAILLASVLAVTAAVSLPASTVLASSKTVSSPRSLYIKNCSSCHGANGRAQTARGRKLEADDLTSGDVKNISESKMTRVIKNGKGKMPGFGKKLTAAQIAQISGYVRSL